MKKHAILIFLCALATVFASAQNTTQNYLHTRKMLNSTATGYVDHISYHDGMGRPFQSVEQHWPSSGSAGTLVSQQNYDWLGRPTVAYLPLPETADFVSPTSISTSLASYYGDSFAYHTTAYEATPRERIVSLQGSGSAWQGKKALTEYLTNGSSGELLCQHYKVDTLANVTQSGSYAAGTLQVVKTTDEDGKVGYTFTDKQGRTVLERRMDGTTSFDTYYVYDNYGNLGCVLPPAINGDISTANLNLYAYLYRYNYRNLCVWKKLPGVEHVLYVYDSNDRLTFSQDGNQRNAGKWTFYVYDSQNRLVQQGENTSKAVAASGVYTQNYYDGYDFLGTTGFPTATYTSGNTYGKGSLTGTVTNVLGSTTDKIYTAYYYDIKGRVTKEIRNNLLGGYDITSTTYTFTDKPSTVTHTHTASGKTTRTEVYTYSYDYADRLSTVKHKLGSTEITLASYTYDSLGRPSTKSLHGSNTQTFTYNIRNWLSGISSGKFKQNLYYTDGNGSAYYNGNISSMTWQAGDETTLRGYKYTYDGLDRLKAATYGEGSALSTNSGRFTESVGTYDKNGNIQAGYVRSGVTSTGGYGNVQALTITLNGNQLQAVTDHVPTTGEAEFKDGATETVEYTYDNNGNLTKDSNKGITNITYNCLNLPSVVTFSSGNTITYTYAADGSKLRTVHKIGTTTTTTDYCGNVIYENGVQKRLLTEEGYVDLSVTTPVYYYYLKDHQGNNRVIINSSGTVQETNHYYPFGGLFTSSSVQPYKYNGKELDTKAGLNWYDYGARHYDAVLGRWHTMDPLAEKRYSGSPYSYAGNNPINKIDPTGMLDHWVEDENKRIYWDPNAVSESTTKAGEKYLGKAVVVFEGSRNETLGESNNIYGSDAVTANVTLYNPEGEIKYFKGYTMSSNSDLFGVVADGVYDVNRIGANDRKGPYNSEWTLNNRGKVPAMDNYNPAHPEREPGYLTGVFIHRPNNNGYAGTYWNEGQQRVSGISEGCLLIAPKQWSDFQSQLNSIDKFKLKLNRK